MAPILRASRRRPSAVSAVEPCPVCLEALTEDQFRFPCGHGVCRECNGRLAQRDFLSCPTCSTPREGVSQRQVDSANTARARSEQHEGQRLFVLNDRDGMRVIFFADETGGQHPFSGLLAQEPPSPPAGAEGGAEAEAAPATTGGRSLLTLRGPMRDLVSALLRPTTVQEFLAQRERALRAP